VEQSLYPFFKLREEFFTTKCDITYFLPFLGHFPRAGVSKFPPPPPQFPAFPTFGLHTSPPRKFTKKVGEIVGKIYIIQTSLALSTLIEGAVIDFINVLKHQLAALITQMQRVFLLEIQLL
jgi:hypothetical protein